MYDNATLEVTLIFLIEPAVIVVPKQPIVFPLFFDRSCTGCRWIPPGDLGSNVIERMGMTIVLQGPGLDPSVADLAVDVIADPGRSFHLGVEVAVVDVSRVGRNPPEAGADLLVGRVQGDGEIGP